MERKRSAAAEARRAAKRAALAPAPAPTPVPAAPQMTRQEQFARQRAEKRSPAAMARRAARRAGAVAAPVPASAPAPAPAPAPSSAPAPAPSSARAPRSAAAEARRAAKRAAAPVGEAPPKQAKKTTAWGAQADDATTQRNAELRARFKEDLSSLSADDRARAEQLIARDARKAAKKAARGGDSKRSAAFKRRIASDASAGRGRGRGGRGRGRGR